MTRAKRKTAHRRPSRTSAPVRCSVLAAIAIPIAAFAALTLRTQPDTAGSNNPPAAVVRSPLPISIEVDGRFQDLVEVPQDLFDGGWTTNLTQSEIAGGAEPGRKRALSLYPKGSLDTFDLARYLAAVTGSARTHVPRSATGVATLDFEEGLLPWAEKSRDKYKEALTDERFEELAQTFFVRAIKVANATRPNAKWSYWGYPRTWQTQEQIERMAEIYAECDAIAPCLYIRRSGDTRAIERFVKEMGERVASVKENHPDPDRLVVAAYLWDKNSAIDHQRPRIEASLEDLLTTARAAEAWADQLVLWLGAGSEAEAADLTESLAPGGHIHTFIKAYRDNRGQDGPE